ncbi:MAG TPA: pentapeptide repeat-containing protein, partial [Ktedonobacterales bacterium]|nr:pentapeptide repeat-containing protein [Ktedonobacterales bacterium]
YGLGSVLYTMLTGHAPFEGTSLTAILVSKLQDAPPDPRALRPELPDPAAACVLKALARDPNQRFATAGDFAQAFGAGLQGIWAPGVDPIGILLPPPGTVARSAPWTALPGVPIPGATITAIPPRPTAKRATPRFFLWRMLAAVLAALARPFRRAPAAAPADIAARASTTMVSVSPASPWLSDETIFTRRQAASDAAVAPAFANATLLFPRGFAEDTRRLNLAEARAASQANLAAHRAPYAGVRVRSRDDLQLLLRDQGWSLVPSRARQPAADFAEADMDRIDLSALDVMRMNLRGVSLIRANLRGAYLTECVLREADLREVDLRGAYLHAVNLRGANLRGADLSGCRLYHADLRGVDLRLAYMDAATLLKDCVLDTSIWVADVAWNNALLTQLDWSAVRRIADEAAARHAASRRERIQYYHAASRAYRGLTVALRQQGMVGVASGYRLREQALERKSLFLEGRILPWTFSWVLNVVGGYGERPGRALLVYLLTVFGFASAYALIGRGEGVHLPLLAALVYSVTSFHGRGFFPGAIPSLVDPLVWLAALEAVCGLFIELVFIATFSRRFLGS